MTKKELRQLVADNNILLLHRLREEALALIDLYDGEEGSMLALDICGWGLRFGLVSQTEYEYLHGIMTMHERPNVLPATTAA
jgi:hypothetical protein